MFCSNIINRISNNCTINLTKIKNNAQMIKQNKFSIIKILLSVCLEKMHRNLFNSQFKQDYYITWKDKPILMLYSLLFRLIPDFRAYLKHWKPIIIKAYNQKRLSIIRQITFWNIRNVKVDRYSSY